MFAEVFLRHSPIVGLGLAAASALAAGPAAGGGPSFWSYWDRLSGLERQLLLALPESSEGASMLHPVLMEAIASIPQVGREASIRRALAMPLCTYVHMHSCVGNRSAVAWRIQTWRG